MISLRLFHAADPSTEIEARALAGGELVLGRGEDADWRLADPEARLSRRHCTVALAGGEVLLRDLSTNGVFAGAAMQRVAPGADVRLACGDGFRLGDYLVVVDGETDADAAAPTRAACAHDRATPAPAPAPTPPAHASEDTALLEAFCAAAHLDASAFAAEDPAAVMRRLGAVYRGMVAGLAELMDKRTSAKAEYQLDRTTIRALDNNPLRWAGADRVGVDLLLPAQAGFLGGVEAVAAAFADVKTHVLCLSAGSDAMIEAVTQAFDPATIETRAAARPSFLTGAAAAAWKEYLALHAELGSARGEGGLAGRAFRAGYQQRLEALNRPTKV